MRKELLKVMICPDCGSDFHIQDIYNNENHEIDVGIVGCNCSEYPILDGILIYKKPSLKDHLSNTTNIIDKLKKGQIDYARTLPLSHGSLGKKFLYLHLFVSSILGDKRHFYPISPFIKSRKMKFYKNMFGKSSFFDIMDILEPNTWGEYLKHRFSSQTFWSLYPFIPLIEKNNNMILDLGCGAGHGSFVLSKYTNSNNLVCADDNYSMLFLSKKYMAKNANFICLDANTPLPFSDNIFSSIVMMDSLHYVSNRGLLGRECGRIIKQNGLLLLLHLHNSLKDNASKGYPLSPTAWKALFSEFNTYIFPEPSIIEDFVHKSQLDLTINYPDKIINGTNSLSMVGTSDNKLIAKYMNSHQYIGNNMKNPIINPIYNVNKRNNGIDLVRRPPNELFIKENPISMKYLPKTFSITSELSSSIRGRIVGKFDGSSQNKRSLNEMIRKFIIIDAPNEYI